MNRKERLFDFTKFTEKLSGPKITKVLLAVGFLGIALIFLSEFWPSQKAKPAASTSSNISNTADAYAKRMESRLKDIIGKIDGVGRVEVMVTVDSGVEYVYEQGQKQTVDKTQNLQSNGSTQTQESNNSESNPVIVDDGNGGQQPIVKTEIQPNVKGVVVVCDGGGNPKVRESIVETVATALGITANRISVSKYAVK